MIFTLFDIVILTIIGISSLFGLYKGMINITINMLGFIASIIVAIILYPYALVIFSGYIDNDLVTSIISGVSSYIVSLIFFTFLTFKIALLFKELSRGPFDRLLGLILGFLRGGLFALILFSIIAIFTSGTYSEADVSEDIVLNLSSDKYPDWLKNSSTTPYMERTLKNIIKMIPQEVLHSINIPHKDEKNEDIIDTIKKRKGDTSSSVGLPVDEDLENSIEELFSETE